MASMISGAHTSSRHLSPVLANQWHARGGGSIRQSVAQNAVDLSLVKYCAPGHHMMATNQRECANLSANSQHRKMHSSLSFRPTASTLVAAANRRSTTGVLQEFSLLSSLPNLPCSSSVHAHTSCSKPEQPNRFRPLDRHRHPMHCYMPSLSSAYPTPKPFARSQRSSLSSSLLVSSFLPPTHPRSSLFTSFAPPRSGFPSQPCPPRPSHLSPSTTCQLSVPGLPGAASCTIATLASVTSSLPSPPVGGPLTLPVVSLSLLLAVALGGWAWLFRAASMRKDSPPEVVLGEGPLNEELVSKLPRLQEPYKPAPSMINRHLETIFAALFRTRPHIRFRRECLRMADGGTVALDWPVMGDDVDLWSQELPQDAPYLILLPGLTGGSDDTYIRHMLIRVRKAGWGVAVFNSRGCADSPVTSPQFYSASFTEDLRQVIKRVATARPRARLYAAGWSLGANILVRYLGQEGDNTPLAGAVSLCNPFDLVLADQNFHIGFNNFYDQRLAVALGKIFKKHAALFEDIGGEYNIPLVAKAKTVREFDDGLTRVSFGYKSVDDYYYDASSSRMVPHVRIPLLCIQAKDDPIAPVEGIPVDAIKQNPNCMLVVTPYGGHLGWVAGEEALFGAPWTDPLVVEYLVALEEKVKGANAPSAFEKAHGEEGVYALSGVEERGEGVNGGATESREVVW